MVIRYSRFVAEGGTDFAGGVRVIERRDQRLNDAERAVESACITPSFEVMRFGDMPVAELGSLVKMRADVDRVLDGLTLFPFVKFDLGRKIKIMRRSIDGIDAENEKSLDFSVVDVAAQFAQRFEIVHRMRFHRFGVLERCADVAERGIDPMR